MALLLSGDEAAGIYSYKKGIPDLFLSYDRPPTPPSGFVAANDGGYRLDWGFSTLGSDPEIGPLDSLLGVAGAPHPQAGSVLVKAFLSDPGLVDLSDWRGVPLYYGVEWTDFFEPAPWVASTPPHSGNAVAPTTFTPTNRVPTQAVPTSPADGVTVTKFTQTLTATMGTDPDGDALRYRFFYCPDTGCGQKYYYSATNTWVLDGPSAPWTTGIAGSAISKTVTFPTPASLFAQQTLKWGVEMIDRLDAVTSPALANTRSIIVNNPARRRRISLPARSSHRSPAPIPR